MANTQKKKSSSSTASKPKSSQAKKPSTAKKTAPQSSPKKEVPVTVKRQKYAIILTAAAVFLACLVFVEGESFWLSMHNAIFGIFGFCAYALPVLLVYMAIVYAKDKPLGSIASNLTGIAFLVAFLSGAIHIFANDAEYLRDISLSVQIPDCWEKGSTFGNGGVIGAIIGGLIAMALGKTGAGITVVILIFVIAMLLTGTTLLEFISALKKPVERMGELTNEKLEQSAQRREQRELEKAENGEEKPKKKLFSPPEKPTKVVEKYEDNFVEPTPQPEIVDEPVIEPSIPDIPIVNLPDSEQKDVVEETIEEAVKENKKRKKRPSNPDDIPEETKIDDIPVEIIDDEKAAYVFPPVDCLKLAEKEAVTDNMTEMQMGAKKLLATLESFKIKAEVTNICRGPSVTRYELVPDAGVRINKITNLSDDIALRLAATSVRIEAPIPGKSAIGIEVPNAAKSMVTMREIIDTPQFRDAKSKLTVALGKDITGNIICADLAKMPHLLVAGTTGSGKSVCLNSMIVSILYNATPDEVKLVMIDPKMVEFTIYNGIAHLEVPVVSNPRKAAGALGWAVGEMEKRYQLFAENSVRDIKGFNALCESRPDLHKMSQIVIFIDELADLMMVSPKEVEDSICRLAQKARAAGIHLVIATQRPSVDVITGIIKANIPSRIALSVSQQVDSRTILDASGAEKLLGNGDMLFAPVGSSKATRIQGCFISDGEVESVVNHIKNQVQSSYNDEVMKEIEIKAAATEDTKKKAAMDEDEEYDPVLNDAIEVVLNAGGASTTMLQKKLKLGYARASRVMDQLEEKGIVGPAEGAKPRAILISKQQWFEMQALTDGAASAAPNIDDVFEDDDDFAGTDDEF